jgi:acyl-CoA thioesterase-2
MNNPLHNLIELLRLEKIEENIFRGKSQDLGFGSLYGGQVLGQSLSAATQTVPPERKAHSFHAYFLRPGDVKSPVVYEVDCVRDGKSFTTRRVKALQHGRAILTLEASFQVIEQGYSHQDEMPDVEGPEGLVSELDRLRAIKDKLPERIRDQLTSDKPIEFRFVKPANIFKTEKSDPDNYIWFRAAGKIPEDITICRCLLAYASDFGLLRTSLLPHGLTFWDPDFQAASLDHAMWFHRDCGLDEWLLHVTHSSTTGNARGYNTGKIFSRDGKLVASTSQEGLIRQHNYKG